MAFPRPKLPPSTLAAVAVAVLLAVFAGELGRWLGAALVLWIAPGLLAPLHSLPALSRLRPHIPFVCLCLLALALLGDLLLGRPPATRDHGVHYFQTHILVNDLLPHGQLTGWSDRLNNGYPFGDSYPVLGYLWMGGAHVLSLGLISLRTSYAWGMLAVWAVSMWGIWAVAALVTREIQSRARLEVAQWLSPAWAGALAAAAWLVDPGYSRQGGWHYAMFHGVWPQLLSSALWVAAIPLTWRALERASPRRIALAAFAGAGAVLAHPFGMLTLACSALLWLLVLWGTRVMRELPPGAIRVWLVIHAGAALLSAGWVVDFLASADYMGRTPVPWEPLGSLVAQLATGELFERHRAWTGPLALVGIVLAVRSGRVIAWLSLAALLAMLVSSSEAAITVLRLDLVVAGFKNLQFPRYAMALKPMWFALAGVGGALVLAVLARPALSPPSRSAPSQTPTWPRLLACLLFGPLLVSLVDDATRLVPRPAGGVLPLEGSRHEADEDALARALVEERATLGDRPLTVAFLRKGMGSGTYPLFSIADAGARVVLDGHIPSVNFRYRIDRRPVALLRALGVTHVIHDEPLAKKESTLAGELDAVGSFGTYELARLRPAQADAPDPGPAPVVLAPADGVAVTELAPERIELELTDVAPGTLVQLSMAPYRKWVSRAEGGDALPQSGEEVLGGMAALAFMAPGPGHVTVAYEKLPREQFAAWTSLVALVLGLVALAGSKPIAMAERLHAPPVRRIGLVLGLVAACLLITGVLVRQREGLEQTWAPVMAQVPKARGGAHVSDRAFVRDVIDRRSFRTILEPGDVCEGILTKDSMPGCSAAAQRPRVSMIYKSPYLYRCLLLTIPAHGRAQVIVDELEQDEVVLGFFKRTSRGRGAEHVTWALDDVEQGRSLKSARSHVYVVSENHAGEFRLQFDNANPHSEQLCLSLATVR